MVVNPPPKKKNWCILTLLLGSLSLAIVLSCAQQDTTLWQFFFGTLCLFDSIFSGKVWLIGCMILMKKFVSLITAAIEVGKRHFFNNQWKMLPEEKCLIKNLNLTDASHHEKDWVDWIRDTCWNRTLKPQ